MTAMPKRTPSLKKRRGKNLSPQQLYETLCGIYPEEIADKLFKQLMGYPPLFIRKTILELDLSFMKEIVGETEDKK